MVPFCSAIDNHLSFRRYRDGEFWAGHQQFCEQFLNPLLLRSVLGLPHNAWYRGTQEGIPVTELARILPWHCKLGWRMLTYVVLQAHFQARAVDDKGESGAKSGLPPISGPALKLEFGAG